MQLTHSFTVPAPVEVAWETFMDLEKVGGCFPGATVTEVSDDSFSGTVKVKLGPIALVYSGSGQFLERDDAAHRAVIDAKGKDKRGNGTAGATVTIQLAPDGGGTRADVTTELAVTGKPAQFGRGVMQDVSDKLLGQFVGCIEQQLGSAGGVDGAASDVSASEAAQDDTAAEEVAAAWAPDGGAGTDDTVTSAQVESAMDASSAGVAATDGAADATSAAERAADDTAVDEVAAAWDARPHTSSSGTPAPARGQTVQDDHIDLGAVAGPVLLQRYAGYAAAGAVGLVVGWLLGRGSRG